MWGASKAGDVGEGGTKVVSTLPCARAACLPHARFFARAHPRHQSRVALRARRGRAAPACPSSPALEAPTFLAARAWPALPAAAPALTAPAARGVATATSCRAPPAVRGALVGRVLPLLLPKRDIACAAGGAWPGGMLPDGWGWRTSQLCFRRPTPDGPIMPTPLHFLACFCTRSGPDLQDRHSPNGGCAQHLPGRAQQRILHQPGAYRGCSVPWTRARTSPCLHTRVDTTLTH